METSALDWCKNGIFCPQSPKGTQYVLEEKKQDLMRRTPCQHYPWGGSIMLWGYVAASGTGKTAQVDRNVDSGKCQQILEANVKPSVKILKLKSDWLLQQNNNPNYSSKATMNSFNKCKLKVLEWPSLSNNSCLVSQAWSWSTHCPAHFSVIVNDLISRINTNPSINLNITENM